MVENALIYKRYEKKTFSNTGVFYKQTQLPKGYLSTNQ